MLAIFIHLDDTDPSNGGLGVFPGSHLKGPQVIPCLSYLECLLRWWWWQTQNFPPLKSQPFMYLVCLTITINHSLYIYRVTIKEWNNVRLNSDLILSLAEFFSLLGAHQVWSIWWNMPLKVFGWFLSVNTALEAKDTDVWRGTNLGVFLFFRGKGNVLNFWKLTLILSFNHSRPRQLLRALNRRNKFWENTLQHQHNGTQ